MSEKLLHLGFIVDGNRRWAREHHLPTLEGHRQGIKQVEAIVEALQNTEVKFVTFFLFSTENWNRSPEEVKYLMDLAGTSIDRLTKKLQKMGGKFVVLGRPERVDPKLWQKITNSEKVTQNNSGLTVCVCFNYGGQWEITDAAKKAHLAGETEWTPKSFQKYLYHPEIPMLDLIVRTSGEERLSGFMLWRASYAELMFLDKYFPDMSMQDVEYVIKEYHQRSRRFGR